MSETRCRYISSGLPACLAGVRGEEWWCKACADFAIIRWLVDALHYPFDVSFSTPPPVDHHRLADYWNTADGWGLTRDEAFAIVADEAGLTVATTPGAETEPFRFGAPQARDDMGGCCGKPVGCWNDSKGCVWKVDKAEWQAAAADEGGERRG